METDGTTRLYYHRDRPEFRVNEAWPHGGYKPRSEWTTGEVAERVHENADFSCISCIGIRSHWNVLDGKSGERFEIAYIGPGDESYAHLAAKLEERAGKKGLTVLIS